MTKGKWFAVGERLGEWLSPLAGWFGLIAPRTAFRVSEWLLAPNAKELRLQREQAKSLTAILRPVGVVRFVQLNERQVCTECGANVYVTFLETGFCGNCQRAKFIADAREGKLVPRD